MLVPACYALGNTRVPVISSVASVGLTIALNLALVGPLGFVGLALGTSLAAVFNAGFLLRAARLVLREAGGDLGLSPLLRAFVAHLGASLLMGAACHLSWRGLDSILPELLVLSLGDAGRGLLPLFRALKTMLLVFEGVLLTLVLARLFGLRETLDAVDLITKKMKNKLSRRRS